MMKKTIGLAAGAMVLAAAAPQAAAQISGSGSITDFRYELTDLAPDDGVAPWITLREIDVNEYAAVFGNNRREGYPIDSDSHMGLGAAAAETAYGSAYATVKNSLLRVTMNGHYGAYYTAVNKSILITLSPHTEATFSAMTDAVLFAGAEPSDVNVTFEMNGGVKSEESTDPSSITTFVLRRYAQWGSTVGQMSGSLFAQDHPASGEVNLLIDANARALAPIPEPASWTMLLAGLGLLAGAGRRARVLLTAPARS
jgi:hypothetical protein